MTEVPVRTQGREYALRILYAVEMKGGEVSSETVEAPPGWWEPDDDLSPGPSAIRFAQRLCRGAEERREELDEAIRSAMSHWRLERMAPVDRVLLRLGIYELRYCEEIPIEATISEFVDLARHYSDTESRAFVNGILDAVAKQLRERRSEP